MTWRSRQDDPVVDEANDCKTENAGAGGVELAREVRGAEVAREVREADEIADKSAGGGEVWSLESLCELEKRTKLLIKSLERLRLSLVDRP